jgi:hypothetical protein
LRKAEESTEEKEEKPTTNEGNDLWNRTEVKKKKGGA